MVTSIGNMVNQLWINRENLEWQNEYPGDKIFLVLDDYELSFSDFLIIQSDEDLSLYIAGFSFRIIETPVRKADFKTYIRHSEKVTSWGDENYNLILYNLGIYLYGETFSKDRIRIFLSERIKEGDAKLFDSITKLIP